MSFWVFAKKNKDGSFKINLAASYTLNFNHVHLSILILLATSSYYHHLRKDFHMLIIMNHQKLLFHTALWAVLQPVWCGQTLFEVELEFLIKIVLISKIWWVIFLFPVCQRLSFLRHFSINFWFQNGVFFHSLNWLESLKSTISVEKCTL